MTTSTPLTPVKVLNSSPLRSGTRVVIGVITFGELARHYHVPARDHDSGAGYRHAVNPARLAALEIGLRRGKVDFPTPLLLNVAGFGDDDLLEVDGQLQLVMTSPVNVLDGQLRLAALAELRVQDHERWDGFELSFVALLGADEIEELQQFYVVNSTHRTANTALARHLLREHAPEAGLDPHDFGDADKRGQAQAELLVERLAHDSYVWRGHVQFPGVEHAPSLIRASGLAKAIRPLLSKGWFAEASTDDQLHILIAYWRGLSLILSEAFEDPWSYGVQKQNGAVVLSKVMTTAMNVVRDRGLALKDAQSYVDVLGEPLRALSGSNRYGDVVTGAAFWRVGAAGAAGAFSSGAGQRVLVARIKALLVRDEAHPTALQQDFVVALKASLPGSDKE